MMTCRELAELLIDFVSGDLTPEHRGRFEEHLGACPPCVAFLETICLGNLIFSPGACCWTIPIMRAATGASRPAILITTRP